VQYNLRLRRNRLLNKRLDSDPIVLDDLDPTSDWVAETHPPEFDVDHDLEAELAGQVQMGCRSTIRAPRSDSSVRHGRP
jgi:hypothetical protein